MIVPVLWMIGPLSYMVKSVSWIIVIVLWMIVYCTYIRNDHGCIVNDYALIVNNIVCIFDGILNDRICIVSDLPVSRFYIGWDYMHQDRLTAFLLCVIDPPPPKKEKTVLTSINLEIILQYKHRLWSEIQCNLFEVVLQPLQTVILIKDICMHI